MRTAHRSLTLVTAPTAEPVTLQEAKNWAKIDATEDDPLAASLIAAATQAAEQYLRRSLLTQTWKLTVDLAANTLGETLGDGVYELPVAALYGGLPRAFLLPRGPLQSVASVKTYDADSAETTFASTNYYVDTAGDRLALNDAAVWPSNLRARAACAITYVAGYGDTSASVPQPIRTAILMHFQRMYDERTVCDMPENCERLLRQYRHLGEQYA